MVPPSKGNLGPLGTPQLSAEALYGTDKEVHQVMLLVRGIIKLIP